MSDTTLAFHSIAQSNIPPEHKSAIRRFYDRVTGSMSSPVYTKALGHVRETGAVVRQGGEALITGGLLGILDAERGLDLGANKNIPIDGIVAFLGLGGAVVMANDPLGIAPDLRNVGSEALAILVFRKAKAWREKENGKTSNVSVHGDPILDAAASL